MSVSSLITSGSSVSVTDTLIQDLAEQIVLEQVLLNWRFWAVAIALLVVATAGSAFLAAYFTRRGQNHADRADLGPILQQLRATTDAAERVRVEILHADWSTKEWKTLRRTKLEELFHLVYDTRFWVEACADVKVFGHNKPQSADPLPKLEILSRLYFPELLSEVLAFSLTVRELNVLISNTSFELLRVREDNNARLDALKAFSEQWKPLYKKKLEQILVLEKKAPDVIKAVIVGA